MNPDAVSDYWFDQRLMAAALQLAEERRARERHLAAELAVQAGKLGNTRVQGKERSGG